MIRSKSILRGGVLGIAVVGALAFAPPGRKVGYDDTPLLPGSKYRVHDGTRPQPAVVSPGTSSTQETPGKAPSDAIVLFDGSNLDRWTVDNNQPAGWILKDGAMIVPPGGTKGGGTLSSKDQFGDCQLHLEFAAPTPVKGDDQGRGNSGIMFFGRYEIQVLDCYDNLTYPDGTTGAVYGQTPPLVNACRKPGEWQTYDIAFTAPRFDKDGKVVTPAYATVFLNGVLVQNHTEIIGAVAFRAVGTYSPHREKGPLVLQDHGNPVRFRNIWVREIQPRG